MKPFTDDVLYSTSTINDGNMSVKHGNLEEVTNNRAAFFKKLHIPMDDVVTANLTHGTDVAVVDMSHGGTTVDAEVLITNVRGLYLTLSTADCIPSILYDPEHEAVALIHLGYKPSMQHLIKKALVIMVRTFDTNPEKLQIYFGPSIHAESYICKNIDQKDLPEWQPFLEPKDDGAFAVDLIGFNIQELLDVGVPIEHIYVHESDTYKSSIYFSHYRSMRTGEPEGRMLTVVGIKTLSS